MYHGRRTLARLGPDSRTMTPMRAYETLGAFYLGRRVGSLEDAGASASPASPIEPLLLDSRDLTTHAVIVGMTGSGKTGLGIGLLEEAALDGIPAIAIDPKGDLGNLALAFPELRPQDFRPWVDPDAAQRAGQDPDAFAAATAGRWAEGLARWDQDGERVARYAAAAVRTVFTPGGSGNVTGPDTSVTLAPSAAAARAMA